MPAFLRRKCFSVLELLGMMALVYMTAAYSSSMVAAEQPPLLDTNAAPQEPTPAETAPPMEPQTQLVVEIDASKGRTVPVTEKPAPQASAAMKPPVFGPELPPAASSAPKGAEVHKADPTPAPEEEREEAQAEQVAKFPTAGTVEQHMAQAPDDTRPPGEQGREALLEKIRALDRERTALLRSKLPENLLTDTDCLNWRRDRKQKLRTNDEQAEKLWTAYWYVNHHERQLTRAERQLAQARKAVESAKGNLTKAQKRLAELEEKVQVATQTLEKSVAEAKNPEKASAD